MPEQSSNRWRPWALVATAGALAIWRIFGDNPLAQHEHLADGDTVVAPAEHASLPAASESDSPRWQTSEFDLFKSKRWTIIQPPPPPPPPPAPSAPALPFTYSGSMGEGADRVYFLNKGQDSVQAAIGDTIDDKYHFDGIEDGKLAFTYLPLKIKQYLPTSTK